MVIPKPAWKTTGLLSARATSPGADESLALGNSLRLSHQACLLVLSRSSQEGVHELWICSLTLGFVWDYKFRLANGCGNNRLTKSVFLYSQADPDLKNSCGSSIVCWGTLQLMLQGRRWGTECSAGWSYHGCFLDSSSKGYICFQAAYPCLCNTYSPSFSLWALHSVIYVIYTISLNQTEEKPRVMHKTEFFQIQDERLFSKYLFAMDFSYHFYFFPIIRFFLPVSKCQSDALRVSFKKFLSYSLGTHCGQFKGKALGLL